jgi:lysozyme family protein
MLGFLALQRQGNPKAWILAVVVLAAGLVGSMLWWRVRGIAVAGSAGKA